MTKAALRRGALVSGGTLADGACIAVGDTPRDVAAGHGAGIARRRRRHRQLHAAALREAGADWALESVEHGFPV